MPGNGVITVEDLLRSPALQLRLIAGQSGVSRRVAWAHVSELEDPTPWLCGAEMIMTTGMAIPRNAERQRAYVERLDDAGVACLAVSEGMFVPPLTRALQAVVARRGFPVVEVPIPVPFIAISQEVAAAAQGDMGARLNAQLRVFGAVQWLAAGQLSTREIFGRLERLSGYTLYACTLQGAPLLDGVPVPLPEHAELMPRALPSPPTVPGGYVLPVAGPRGPAGYILALEAPAAAPAGVSVVQHIATVAALQLSMVAHEREMLRRQGAETLAEMLQHALDPAVVARRLVTSGFLLDRALRLAIVGPAHGRDTPDGDSLADALAGCGAPHLILRQGGVLFVLINDDQAVAALASLEQATVGISRAFTAGAPLTIPRREAEWARARAGEAGRKVMTYGSDPTQKWLTDESADLAALAAEVLGSVLSYDHTHAAELVPSVRIWLEHDRHTERAARALHVHPNTLRYRLQRFEEVSGRKLSSTASLAEVWLALRATADATAAEPVR
ncbi:MAG TPA: PucR family transcriptional regulator ligand-binding domain-containing protein [Streptosporangiaceae bacterium]|jgi:purine catabolism regulator